MFLDDFLLTHIMFMPTHQLITELMRKYPFWPSLEAVECTIAVVVSVPNSNRFDNCSGNELDNENLGG